jgi:hypothetical protein
MEREMFGMRNAIYGEGQYQSGEGDEQDEELKVEQLGNLMLKMQVVKGNTTAKLKELANSEVHWFGLYEEMSADMPETERRKFAAKAVTDIMKTL